MGAHGHRAVDFRIIAATNRPLADMSRRGPFGGPLLPADVVAVRVPPLRERKDDIPLLVQHFLEKRSGRGAPGLRDQP